MRTRHHDMVSSHQAGSKNKWPEFLSAFSIRCCLLFIHSVNQKPYSVMVYTRRVHLGPFYFKAILKHICSNNPYTSTDLQGRKTQFAEQHADRPSWFSTKKHKAHHCIFTLTSKDQTFLLCFLIPSSDLYFAFWVTISKLPLMSKTSSELLS